MTKTDLWSRQGKNSRRERVADNLKFYQGKNEQNMALAAVAYAKQMDRKAIIPCVSSIGRGQNAQKAAVFPRCLG